MIKAQNHASLVTTARVRVRFFISKGLKSHISTGKLKSTSSLDCRNRPSVRTPSKFSRVECMQMHFSYLNFTTSKGPDESTLCRDAFFFFLCVTVCTIQNVYILYVRDLQEDTMLFQSPVLFSERYI